jgi:hypothetical protein
MFASGNIPMSDDNFVSLIILVRYGGRGMDVAWFNVLCTFGICLVVVKGLVVGSIEVICDGCCLGDMKKLGEEAVVAVGVALIELAVVVAVVGAAE